MFFSKEELSPQNICIPSLFRALFLTFHLFFSYAREKGLKNIRCEQRGVYAKYHDHLQLLRLRLRCVSFRRRQSCGGLVSQQTTSHQPRQPLLQRLAPASVYSFKEQANKTITSQKRQTATSKLGRGLRGYGKRSPQKHRSLRTRLHRCTCFCQMQQRRKLSFTKTYSRRDRNQQHRPLRKALTRIHSGRSCHKFWIWSHDKFH